MVLKRNLGNIFYLLYQVLQINLRVVLKNNICTYDPLAFKLVYARRS